MPCSLLSSTLFYLSLMFKFLLMQHTAVPVEAQNQAQIQAPDCLPDVMVDWYWTYNSLNQSPCETAAYIAAPCHNEQFTIQPIPEGGLCDGPTESDAGDICICNSVYYSLISACAGCQNGVWISYEDWYTNCTTVSPMSTFPQSINNDTSVPAWAFVNTSETTPWDNVSACAVGDDPESTGTFRPPFAPKFNERHAARIGVIVGVTIGCTIAVLVVIGTGAWFFLRRRQGRRQQDTTNDIYDITPWTPDPTDHSATEYSSQHPDPNTNRYSGYPEI